MSTKPVTCYLDETAEVSKYILGLNRLERQAEIRKLLSAGYAARLNNKSPEPALTSQSHEAPPKSHQPENKLKSTALSNLNNL